MLSPWAETASPTANILRAALTSRSWIEPHSGACPLADTQGHFRRNMSAVATPLAGWVPAVDPNQRAPVPPGFVRQLPHEFRPACVADRFRQGAVLFHIADGKAFDGDHLVFVYQPCRELVQEIPARVRNLRVQICHLQLRLGAASRSFFLLCEPALQSCELRLMPTKRPGRGDLFAARKNREMGQAKINADFALRLRFERHGVIAEDRNVVSTGRILRYGDGRGRCTLRQCTRPAYCQRRIHLRELKRLAVPLEGARRVFRRLHAVFAPETRVLCALAKEVGECGLQVSQRLLYGHRTNLVQPRVRVFLSAVRAAEVS